MARPITETIADARRAVAEWERIAERTDQDHQSARRRLAELLNVESELAEESLRAKHQLANARELLARVEGMRP